MPVEIDYTRHLQRNYQSAPGVEFDVIPYLKASGPRHHLGDDAVVIGVKAVGVIVAVKGCTSLDDIKAKLDAGDEVEGIVISILAGKATGAKYKSITKDDLTI